MKKFTFKNKNNNNSLIREEVSEDTRKEDVSKRSTFTKHFINDDGSYTMEVSPFPIHYYDTNKHSYEEIDNSMIEKDDKFAIMRNKMKLAFNKEIGDNIPLFNLENNGYNFNLFYLGKKDNIEKTALKKSKAKTKHISKQISNLIYEEIDSGIDLEYSVQFNRIKENIIVKEKQNNYEFSFLVDIGDLNVRLSEDESRIELVDKHQKVQYTIPSPIMFDSNNFESTDLGYEIETTKDGKLIFTLKANADWINAKERTFPVTIDPQVEIIIDDDHNIIKHYQIQNNFASAPLLNIIKLDNSSQSRAYLIVFDLRQLLPRVNVSEATLSYKTANIVSNSVQIASYYYEISTTEEIQDFFPINTSNETSYKLFKFNSEEISISIDDAFNNWINERKKYGALLFKYSGVINGTYSFYLPTITIKYILENGLPSYYSNLKNGFVTEAVTGDEVGLKNASDKNGILLTHIDSKSNILYQTLRTKNMIYTRNSIDQDT